MWLGFWWWKDIKCGRGGRRVRVVGDREEREVVGRVEGFRE